jgi:hypothetical protein
MAPVGVDDLFSSGSLVSAAEVAPVVAELVVVGPPLSPSEVAEVAEVDSVSEEVDDSVVDDSVDSVDEDSVLDEEDEDRVLELDEDEDEVVVV